MERALLILLVIVTNLVVLVGEVHSAPLRATALKGIPVPVMSSPNRAGADYYAKISDNRLVYLQSSDYAATYSFTESEISVYIYDIAKETSELVLTVDATESAPQTLGTKAVALKNGALLVINGGLYFTDGTKAGTRFIKAFGTRYCCGYGDNLSRVTVVGTNDNLAYLQVDEKIYGWDRGYYVRETRLWQSDGTQAGTRPSGSKHERSILGDQISIKTPFMHTSANGAELHYFLTTYSGSTIWKVVAGNRSQLVLRH